MKELLLINAPAKAESQEGKSAQKMSRFQRLIEYPELNRNAEEVKIAHAEHKRAVYTECSR